MRPDDLTVPEDVLLRDLRYHWGEAYVIGFDPDGDEENPWRAVRRDDPAAVFRRETSSALRDTMRINYRERPVPHAAQDRGGLDQLELPGKSRRSRRRIAVAARRQRRQAPP